MTPSFQISGLPAADFQPMFAWSEDRLKAMGAQRHTADESSGFPCRISLQDAAIGDELLLLPFVHQPAASPYRASGPIFVRRGAVTASLAVDEVPKYVTRRLISLRGYDAADVLVTAEVVDGPAVESAIRRLFSSTEVRYLHLHNARQGCYSCRVDRA